MTPSHRRLTASAAYGRRAGARLISGHRWRRVRRPLPARSRRPAGRRARAADVRDRSARCRSPAGAGQVAHQLTTTVRSPLPRRLPRTSSRAAPAAGNGRTGQAHEIGRARWRGRRRRRQATARSPGCRRPVASRAPARHARPGAARWRSWSTRAGSDVSVARRVARARDKAVRTSGAGAPARRLRVEDAVEPSIAMTRTRKARWHDRQRLARGAQAASSADQVRQQRRAAKRERARAMVRAPGRLRAATGWPARRAIQPPGCTGQAMRHGVAQQQADRGGHDQRRERPDRRRPAGPAITVCHQSVR